MQWARFIFLFFFLTQSAIAVTPSQTWTPTLRQQPPLKVNPGQQCEHNEGTPFLKGDAHPKTRYRKAQPSNSPYTWVEELKMEKGVVFAVISQGCADFVVTFLIEDLKSKSALESVKLLSDIVAKVQRSPEALVSERFFTQVQAWLKEQSETKTTSQKIDQGVCIENSSGTCITDMWLKATRKTVSLRFIDRP